MLNLRVKSFGLSFLVSILVLSCQSSGKTEVEETSDPAPEVSSVIDFSVVRQLLVQSQKSDTIQMYSANPFLFYKTGFLFDSKLRHSIVLSCTNDSTYALRLYQVNDSSWSLIDSLGGMPANRTVFYIESKDYNFDREADIYIQNSYSNGYPISTGYIILVDPVTRHLTLLPGSGRYGNISADPSTKILHSESKYEGPVNSGEEKIWVRKSRWEKDHYTTIDSSLETVSAQK